MEPRQFLTATPIQVGAVYYEADSGTDSTPNTFTVTWSGGATGTQLTQVVIDLDKNGDGSISADECFFDTASGGLGVYGYSAFQVVTNSGVTTVNATVSDDGQSLVLDFTGFDAGDKLVFTIDVDEMGDSSTVSAVAEGKEFQGSTFSALFSNEHYYDATVTDIFTDEYDNKLSGAGLDLPPDDYMPPAETDLTDRTAGAVSGYVQQALPITLSGTVYEDTDMDNTQDTGELGIGGVTLTLYELDSNGDYVSTGLTTVTDSNGDYEFTIEEGVDEGPNALGPGTFAVVETQPTGYYSVGAKAGNVGGVTRGTVYSSDELRGITLEGGDDSVENNFAEVKPAAVSGYVYYDANNNGVFDTGESGISDVTVQLLDAGGAVVETTTTNSSGAYTFTELMPGAYSLHEVQPTGYLQGTNTVGTAGGTLQATDSIIDVGLTSGASGTDYDFGELLPSSISGYVYDDANGNGVHDSGEAAISGVTVYLLDANGNTTGTTVTDTNGYYEFTGLAPGTYGVHEVQPAGYLDGADLVGSAGGTLSGTDSIVSIVLTPGADGTHYDFLEIKPSSISGYVYEDTNYNGQHDSGEAAIAGVTIHLLDSSGNIVGTTTTNSIGYYEFTVLAPGTYGVHEVQPAGYLDGADLVGSAGGTLSGTDSIVSIVLAPNTNGADYDFLEVVGSSISGYVYVDANNNGVRDSGEAGIAGVTLTLLDDSGNSTGATVVTDSNGYYIFTGLYPDTYGVAETQPSGYYDGLDVAGTAGGAAHNPGDSITGATLTSGANATDYDFGELEPASISGYVYVDANSNGVRDSGETGIAGVTMTLLDSSGNSTGVTTTTDSNGHYEFTNLEPGTYGVAEAQPSGYVDGLDVAGTAGGAAHNPGDSITGATLGSGAKATDYDFGELNLASISGTVYYDGNKNGMLDSGESGIADVIVYLLDSSGNQIASTTTNSAGQYSFTGLEPGTYGVAEVQPSAYLDGAEQVGSAGGTIDVNDRITNITLSTNVNATGYNFGEILQGVIPPPVPPVDPPSPLNTPFLSPSQPQSVLLAMASDGSGGWNYSSLSGGGGVPGAEYTWHLSVIDGGQPRNNQSTPDTGLASINNVYFDATSWTGADMTQSTFVLADGEGNVLRSLLFGLDGAIPVIGDWNGDGTSKVGVCFDGIWFLDLNGNGRWDEGDLWSRLGKAGDLAITGDWDGDGKTDIGIYGLKWLNDDRAIRSESGLPDTDNQRVAGRPKNLPPDPEEAAAGYRTLKRTSLGKFRQDLIDHVFKYGSERDVPLAGDWNGDGVSTIGVFRDGEWYLDVNGNGKWDQGDVFARFGQPGDIPVVGDWTGDGIKKLGVYRNGTWYLDVQNRKVLDAHARVFRLGESGDIPVVGDWTGDGIDKVGVYKSGVATKPAQISQTPTLAPSRVARKGDAPVGVGVPAGQSSGDFHVESIPSATPAAPAPAALPAPASE